MHIIMSGLDDRLAPISLREQLSFTKTKTGETIQKIAGSEGVSGGVLISTCNRTELYLTSEDKTLNPGELLCKAAGTEYTPYQQAFVRRTDEQAIRHLLEVSAGLCSRIWGEDQILSQVKNAILIARKAHAADSVLEALFREAAASGKEVKSKAHLNALPTSAASMAVALLQDKTGGLKGKRAMVIGNGEMGRLAAALLQQAGADVSVTLRTYRHGETIVPPGCSVVPYEERMKHMNGLDILLSATTSPHYTVTVQQMQELDVPPAQIVDLAIPRDIQPEVNSIQGISLYNIDDLGDGIVNRKIPAAVETILQSHQKQFYRWYNYKDCLPSMDSLKSAITDRIFAVRDLEENLCEEDLIELAVSKTVELMAGGLAETLSPEKLSRCEKKIRAHTRT